MSGSMPGDESQLLHDMGRLLSRSHDLEETLGNVVRLVARWMHAGGCSIFLAEDDEALVLRATRGLRADAVGRVRLAPGQGIVGRCLESREPIAVPDVREEPRFLPFPESGEARFRSLLAVPLIVRDHPIGVLTVQTARPRSFASSEVDLLETIAAQVATIVLNARLLDRAYREGSLGVPAAPVVERAPPAAGTVLRGIAISPGVAIGGVHLQPPRPDLATLRYRPTRSSRSEWRALERALRETVRQISDLREAVGERFGEEFAEVFTTHIMILEDQGFREKVRRLVFDHGNGVRALVETMREYSQIFSATGDPTLRERAADIEDVIHRAVGELVGIREHNPPLRDGVIVVADRIVPSEFMLLETEKIAGFATAHGGAASHAAIFARSLEIPAVTALRLAPGDIRPTDRVIVDGIEGVVIVNPTPEQVEEWEAQRQRFAHLLERLDELRDTPPRTPDGEDVLLSANIGGLNDLEQVKKYGARGIGLFRTEILALSQRGFPDEDEQVGIYRRVAETVAPDWVTVRTFDFGGDKVLPGSQQEENPQLGLRSIRLLLDQEPVFRRQLRAILRANTVGNLRVMIPMVTRLEELDATRALLRDVCDELGSAKPPPLGVMIETPAAVALIDHIARAVDFVSIGTNDLVQYTLAVDRANERVAAGYDPFHPAVLQQIRRVSEAARAAGIGCSVCGELAGNPVATPMLVGFGIRELSMTPFWVMAVRQVVSSISAADCEELAAEVIGCGRGSEVRECIARAFAEAGLLDDPDFGPGLQRLLEPRVVDSERVDK